ncbi:DUF2059 domain-containing protein [Edaphobacter paludis]|uniref:DUF2059 domain-containing protein n=1 Tax=Edaphobacter paludis TaxID=3035702 RepID=A0AAU7CVC2_9BACT
MPNQLKSCAVILVISLAASVSAQTSQPIPAATPSPQTQTTKAPSEDLVPAHPATVEQIHEYYRLTHAIETAHKLMFQMVNGMQSSSAPYLPTAFWDDMKTSIGNIDLESAFIPAYQRYFSEEEMGAVIAFYKSPAGQHLLQSQPFIESFAGDQLREAGQKVGREVYLRHKDEIEAAKKKYEAAQVPASAADQK